MTKRILRASSVVILGAVSCLACSLIAVLVGVGGFSQLGPGGLLSEVRVGSTAPDFELATVDGGSVRLQDYRGQPVAINFWATWCPGCVKEMPDLEAAMRDHASEGLVVLAVNAGQRAEHVQSFLDWRGVHDLPVPLDLGKKVYDRYRIVALPTTVWLDRDGVVRAVHTGALTSDDIDRYVEQLMAATPSP